MSRRNTISTCLAAASVIAAASFVHLATAAPLQQGLATAWGASEAILNGLAKGPDYADGLSGGPDFWEVTGIAAGGLSMREKPSPRARLVKQFQNGTVLKNLGCENRRGKRWCNVERPDDPSARGWVNGRYLRESTGPK